LLLSRALKILVMPLINFTFTQHCPLTHSYTHWALSSTEPNQLSVLSTSTIPIKTM